MISGHLDIFQYNEKKTSIKLNEYVFTFILVN